MTIRKAFIAHSWTDIAINIQTKAVAKRLSEKIPVIYFSQSRIGRNELKITDTLSVVEWPNKRPNTVKDFLFILKKIRREKPDVLIVHFGATNVCMVASWLLRVKHRICWMHTLTDQFYLDSKGNSAVAKTAINRRRYSYWFATHIIVLNEFAKKDAVLGYKIPISKIVKIYNGIMPIKNSMNLGQTSFSQIKSIIYLGRLDESKGVDILLKAFEILIKNRHDVCLEIGGEGSKELQIKEWVKNHEMESKVIFWGSISNRQDKENFICKAYCMIVPSRIDNFPTVILEGFAAGVPVIASAVGGITDMIEDGKTGMLFEQENVIQLADAMIKIVSDITFRNKIAQQGKDRFNNNFTIERHVNNVIKFLDDLA